MSDLALNSVNFNMGLFEAILKMESEELFWIDIQAVNLLREALDTTRFQEEYPWEDLGAIPELREFFPEMYQPTNPELWGKLLENYIFPAARKLANFYVGDYIILAEVRLRARERAVWQRLFDQLKKWDKVPVGLPKLFASAA